MSAPPTNNRHVQEPSTSAANAAAPRRENCAFCRHQRRKCRDDCPTAPYFPASNEWDFENAHKLFGLSNIVKALEKVPAELREQTANSLKYEANTRAMSPVHGCTGVIQQLQSKLDELTLELHNTRNQLQFYRSMQQQYQFMPNPHYQKN